MIKKKSSLEIYLYSTWRSLFFPALLFPANTIRAWSSDIRKADTMDLNFSWFLMTMTDEKSFQMRQFHRDVKTILFSYTYCSVKILWLIK